MDKLIETIRKANLLLIFLSAVCIFALGDYMVLYRSQNIRNEIIDTRNRHYQIGLLLLELERLYSEAKLDLIRTKLVDFQSRYQEYIERYAREIRKVKWDRDVDLFLSGIKKITDFALIYADSSSTLKTPGQFDSLGYIHIASLGLTIIFDKLHFDTTNGRAWFSPPLSSLDTAICLYLFATDLEIQHRNDSTSYYDNLGFGLSAFPGVKELKHVHNSLSDKLILLDAKLSNEVPRSYEIPGIGISISAAIYPLVYIIVIILIYSYIYQVLGMIVDNFLAFQKADLPWVVFAQRPAYYIFPYIYLYFPAAVGVAALLIVIRHPLSLFGLSSSATTGFYTLLLILFVTIQLFIAIRITFKTKQIKSRIT